MQNGSRFYELTWELNNMNRDDIIRMAREAGLAEWHESIQQDGFRFADPDRLERFAALVAATELNRCVLILERLHERSGGQYNYYLHAAKVLKGGV
jgi:hypothetical protein